MEPDVPPYKEGDQYESWRSEVLKWQLFTQMEPRKQALAVRAKLSGELREKALMLDAGTLFSEDGLHILMRNLDEAFREQEMNEPHKKVELRKQYNKHRRKWDDQNPTFDSREDGRAHRMKWDQEPKFNNEQNFHDQYGRRFDEVEISATEKARLRAAKLSAKLAAEGKYQAKPMSLLPTSVCNPSQQFQNKMNGKPPPPTHIKKLENGGYFAEFDINDVAARTFLTKASTQDLIGQQSGVSVTLRGRYLTPEDKRRLIISGTVEKQLSLTLQADVAAKVQVALHKVQQVVDNYEHQGENGLTTKYGLLGSQLLQSNHYFLQDKVFVGLEDLHKDFPLSMKVAGPNNSNFNFIVQQTGAKVFLRGKGSGYLEPNTGREAFEALHIYISHTNNEGLGRTRALCCSLVDTVKKEYNEWQQTRFINQGGAMSYPPPQAPTRPSPHTMFYPQQKVIPPNRFASFPSVYPNQKTIDQHRYENRERAHERSQDACDSTYDRHYNRRRSRSRERPSREQRSRSRERRSSSRERRSRSRERRSKSRERRSRSRERYKELSFEEDRKSSRDKKTPPKRRFTEEPRKKRKFSEDPKVIQKHEDESKKEAPKLQFRSPKREPKVDPFMPPPPLPPSLPKGFKESIEVTEEIVDNQFDMFKVPLSIMKPKPKALKMGALSTIAVYSDSDDDDPG